MSKETKRLIFIVGMALAVIQLYPLLLAWLMRREAQRS